MARVQANYSKRTGELLNFKWIALLGRDENKKQIQLSKRVEPFGLTPKAEIKKQQQEANRWEEEERKKQEASRETLQERRRKEKERDTITLESFIDNVWMPKHVKDGSHSPDTIAFFTHESNNIKAYFNQYAPGIKLSAMNVETVLDYITYLRTDARTKRGTPYSATSIQHCFSTLRNILEYAVYIEYIPDDPCKKLKPNDRPKREQKDVDFLTEKEAVKFIEALDSQEETEYWQQKGMARTYLFWKCMFNVFISTGLRRGELCGLQWSDLDEDNKVLHVCRNVTIDKNAGNKLHIGQTKGKTTRKVPVSGYVMELLSLLREEQKKELGIDDVLPEYYIFQSLKDPMQPVYPTEPTRLMSKFVKRHGLREVSVHDLRHSAASIAIQSGANVKQIQMLLGHRDAATTLKFYTGITEQAQAETVDYIERKIRPQKDNQQETEPQS